MTAGTNRSEQYLVEREEREGLKLRDETPDSVQSDGWSPGALLPSSSITLRLPVYVKSVFLGLLFPQDMQMLEGSIYEHWLQDDGVSRIHIFIDSVTKGEQQPNHVASETRS